MLSYNYAPRSVIVFFDLITLGGEYNQHAVNPIQYLSRNEHSAYHLIKISFNFL